ncbi:MAG: hypothetical protein ACUVRU_03640 [Anaerolineae bacterium]
MRLLKLLTLLLAIAGTTALVLASRATARPLTLVGSISPSMNFAYVRVEGVVVDYPNLAPEHDYLSFRVRDPSGEIRVSAYRSTVRALLEAGRLPMPGDRTTLEGTLRVRDNEPSLILNVADALTVQTDDARTIDLAALDALPLGGRATVAGQARRVRTVGESLRIITLRQGDTEADVLIPLSLRAVFGTPPDINVGDWLTVTGGVGEYRGRRQVLPASAAAFTIAPDDLKATARRLDLRPIGAFNHDLIGRWVATKGRVTNIREIARGALLKIEDDAGDEITIAMFDAWFSWPFSQTVTLGDHLAVQGALIDYKGKLEIQPQLPIDLIWLQDD